MTLPPRPHNSTCTCDLCVAWAREIVATPTPRKPPATFSCTRREEMPLEAFTNALIATAVKRTGLTEEQLRAKALELGAEMPERVVERASRKTVAARGVPEIHLAAVYDRKPIACEALNAVVETLAGRRHLLVLAGGIGVRKTGSACWALTQKPGRYVKASRLASLAASPVDEDRALFSSLFRCQVLVLDDLGGEYADEKGFFVKTLNELMDERYERKLITIVTTNMRADRFHSQYGERIVDRLGEVGMGAWVNIGGESVRRRAP